MGGRELMKALLAMDPDAKGIVSSGYNNDQVMSSFREYGFSAMAMKPYVLDDLCETLSKLLPETMHGDQGKG